MVRGKSFIGCRPGVLIAEDLDPVYTEFELPPGDHEVRLMFVDETMRLSRIIAQQDITLEAGQILRLVPSSG